MSADRRTLPSGDGATATVFVAVPPETAFDVFTREIDQWWKRGPRYRLAGRRRGLLHIEPGVGGRLFESFEGDSGTRVFEVGRITVWEAPFRLQFEWRNANFAPNETTTVEVRFEPREGGTRVIVQHRGWAALPSGHPARHGSAGAEFSRMIGMWWGELMTSLREHIASTHSRDPND